MLPLWFHVDGVNVYNTRQLVVWSWSSCLAETSATNIWDVKFPFCAVPEEWVSDAADWKRVNAEITKIIADDFQRLMRDDSLRAAFVGVRCDWKARKEIHDLKRHYLCNKICDKCLASKPHSNPDLSYVRVDSEAPWRATVMTNAEFVAEATADARLSPWFGVPGAHTDLFHFDLMHVLFLGWQCCMHMRRHRA